MAYDTIIAGYRYVAYDAEGFGFRVTKECNGTYIARPSHMQASTDHRRFGPVRTLKAICQSIAESKREN